MKKDFKRILKRNYNIEEFVYVVQKLLNGLPLEEKYIFITLVL
jgi:mRNA-degrading endonuclease YafQ of YafQ-DinJ toxin-antitoxin module